MANKIKLNLGSGGRLLGDGWINVDNYFDLKDLVKGQKTKKGVFGQANVPKGAKFVRADILKLPFPDEYADFVMMDNVLEHIPIHKAIPALKEANRVMKKGATLRIIVPAIEGMILTYLRNAMTAPFDLQKYIDLMHVIMGGQTTEGEFHRSLYNVDFLNHVIISSNFKNGAIFYIPAGTAVPIEIRSFARSERKGWAAKHDWLIANMTK